MDSGRRAEGIACCRTGWYDLACPRAAKEIVTEILLC